MNESEHTIIVEAANRRVLVEAAPKDGYTFFRYVGCFTEKEREALGKFNKAVTECQGKAALIDMTDSFLIDAYGLGNLLILGGAMVAQHKTLAILINGDSAVLKRLRATQISNVIPIYTSIAECAVAFSRL